MYKRNDTASAASAGRVTETAMIAGRFDCIRDESAGSETVDMVMMAALPVCVTDGFSFGVGIHVRER